MSSANDNVGLPVQELPSAEWQKGYEAGARVRARIIYVDPVSKRVCLSLLPHLVAGVSSPPLPAINTLFEVCSLWSVSSGQHHRLK